MDKKNLGKYQVEAPIGSGAYADVFQATDTTLKRTIALKLLKPMLVADSETFGIFTCEQCHKRMSKRCYLG